MLEGIRGARLFKHARFKSVRDRLPSRIWVLSRHVYWQLCTYRWWVTPCRITRQPEESERHTRSVPSYSRRKKGSPVLMGTQLRVKNPYVCCQMYRSHRVELPGISQCISYVGRCANTLVTLSARVNKKKFQFGFFQKKLICRCYFFIAIKKSSYRFRWELIG